MVKLTPRIAKKAAPARESTPSTELGTPPLQAMLDDSPRVRQLGALGQTLEGAGIVQRSVIIGDPPDGSYYNAFSVDSALETIGAKLLKSGITEDRARRTLARFDDEDAHFESWDDLAEYVEDPSFGYDSVVGPDAVYIESGSRKSEVKQKKRAENLIRLIRENFGVNIDSRSATKVLEASLEDNRNDFTAKQYQLGLERLESVKAASWEVDDLEALYEALSRFRPILGKRRASSPRANVPQEITTFGKVNQDVTLGGTLAETFANNRTILMYEDGLTENDEEPEHADKLSTFVHELTHGLLEHRIAEFEQLGFWQWLDTHEDSDPKDYDGERPPNSVALGSVYEDMAESVAMFLSTRDSRRKLESEFPQRFAIVSQILEDEFGEVPRLR